MKINKIIVWGKDSLVYKGLVWKPTKELIEQIEFLEHRIYFIHHTYTINLNQ